MSVNGVELTRSLLEIYNARNGSLISESCSIIEFVFFRKSEKLILFGRVQLCSIVFDFFTKIATGKLSSKSWSVPNVRFQYTRM